MIEIWSRRQTANYCSVGSYSANDTDTLWLNWMICFKLNRKISGENSCVASVFCFISMLDSDITVFCCCFVFVFSMCNKGSAPLTGLSLISCQLAFIHFSFQTPRVAAFNSACRSCRTCRHLRRPMKHWCLGSPSHPSATVRTRQHVGGRDGP